jgi:predicted transcriptional regulator
MANSDISRIKTNLNKALERKKKLQSDMRKVNSKIKDLEQELDAIQGRILMEKLNERGITEISQLVEALKNVEEESHEEG